MKNCYRVLGIVLCIGLIAGRGFGKDAGRGFSLAGASQSSYDKYLTAADVEKATGLKGISLVPRGSAPGAGGDLNFANDSGDVVLMVQFASAKNFAAFKTKYGKTPVGGVGEQAVEGGSLPGMPDNLLAFTKGTRCIVLTAFGDFVSKKVYLTINQLTSVGKLIASRL